MTESLSERIQRHEGFTDLPKPDAKGMYEIGYGHDITPAQAFGEYAAGISEAQALDLLDADIAKAQTELVKDLPWTAELPQFKQDLLTEMVFQLGVNGLLGFHNLLFCARSGDDDGVAHAMLNSLWHRQTPGRCEELANLWLDGEPPTSTS